MPKNLISILIILFSIGINGCRGQSYEWATGLKLSKFIGISTVYSPAPHYSIEGIISKNLWTNESGLSLIGRFHRKIISRGLNIYGGGGLHYGMYEDGERNNFGGLILQGGAEMSLGKTNMSFNLTPMIGVGSENVKFRIGSDVTIRYILKKQPREQGKLLQKLGISKNRSKSNKSNNRDNGKRDAKGKFWDFEWLKK